MRKRSRRRDLSSPSSRRGGGNVGYRFATAAALARLGVEHPRSMVRTWRPWIDARMREGATTPEQAAKHIAGVEQKRSRFSSRPPSRDSSLRQGLRSSSRDASRELVRDPRWPKGRPGSGETRTSQKGISYTVCRHGMKIQTLIFPLENFTQGSAEAWAKKHGFRLLKVEETSQSIRIRQNQVEMFIKGSFRTIPIGKSDTIKAVVGCPRLDVYKGGRGVVGKKTEKRREERRRIAA